MLSDRPTITKTFAAHLWLIAKNYEPTRVVSDGAGGYIFYWSPAAADDFAQFHKAKVRLGVLTEQADRERDGAR